MPLQPGPYRNLKFRLTAMFVGALFISLRGHFSKIFTALLTPGFYLAFSMSFFISYLMVHCVHLATKWLDNRFGWWEYVFVRIIMQSVFALGLPLLVDLFLISMYFDMKGQNIMTNGFLTIDFPFVVFFMLLLNLCYVIFYLINIIRNLLSLLKRQMPEYARERPHEKTEQAVEIMHNGVSIYYNLQEVLCFYASDKRTRVLTADRKNYAFNEPLMAIEKRYSEEGFMRINKGVLLNMSIIKNYVKGPSRDTLTIQVKQKYEGIIRSLSDGQLNVTKEYIEKVISLFSEG